MTKFDKEQIQKLAQLLKHAAYPIAFTGAGISTESGIPDFRSPGTGLWTQVDPEQISVGAMRTNPMQFYKDYALFVAPLENRKPNKGHEALAELTKRGLLKTVVTQNVDGLHHAGGSPRVLEVHGHVRTCRCQKCQREYPHEDMMKPVAKGELPYSTCCNALLRTNVVLFGDAMSPDFDIAWQEAGKSDLVLAIGSSLTVYPASQIPFRGSRFALINRDLTGHESQAAVTIQGEIGEILEELLRQLD